MVIGGGQVYEEALPLASRIYLTEVHVSPEGDTAFPSLDPREWREIRRDAPVSGGNGQPDYSIVVLERRSFFWPGCRARAPDSRPSAGPSRPRNDESAQGSSIAMTKASSTAELTVPAKTAWALISTL